MDDMNTVPDLYHPDILAYARDPSRWREEHDAQYRIKAYNPVCGDKFEIRIDFDTVITDASFFGYGCVVSKASTAVLTEMLMGMTLEEARPMMEAFINSLQEQSFFPETDPRLQSFLIARKYPGRIQCAVLGWEALLRNELFATQ